jgi:hypothetical protein
VKILTGEMTGKNVARLERAGFGRVRIERNWTPYEGESWILDNGAYRMWNKARKELGLTEAAFAAAGSPVEYDWRTFEKRLEEAALLARNGKAPMFVVAPDLVARGASSLTHSLEWTLDFARNRLEPEDERYLAGATKLPIYLPVQDGMTPERLEALLIPGTEDPVLDLFDGIFLGGTAEWKEATAFAWKALCDRWELALHYARAGTIRKLEHAAAAGADSIDSAAFLWSNEKWTAFENRVAELKRRTA